MRHKMDTLTRTVLQFAGAMMMLVVIAFFASTASAQDAIDVQQDLDIATVNSKAEDARGKAIGVEGRLTTAEGTIANHGSQVSAIATGQQTLEQRVATLEAAPPPPPSNEAQVNSNTARIAALETAPSYDDTALAARVTALESQPAPTITKWVVRDSLGAFVGEWSDRGLVGDGVYTMPYGDLAFHVTQAQFSVKFNPPKLYFTQMNCDMETAHTLYRDANSGAVITPKAEATFTGLTNGFVAPFLGEPHVWLPDYSQEAYMNLVWYTRDGTGGCSGKSTQGYFVPYTIAGPLPTFTPPFTVAEE